MSQAVLQVVILRDGLLVGTEVLVPGTYTVGSTSDAELRLEDPTVSSQHAVLYFQNNRAAIQDAASHTGVYVNGHKVSACEIRSVDEVLIGPFVLKVRVLEKKAQPTKPQPPPEVAAMLKAAPASPPAAPRPPSRSAGPTVASAPPQQPPRAAHDVTVASARKLQAVPQSNVPTPAPQRSPHLKSVPLDEERATENTYLPDSVFDEELNTQPAGVPGARAAPNPLSLNVTAPGIVPPAIAQRARGSDRRPGIIRRSNSAPRISPELLASKKPPKLFLELYWGDIRKESRSFTLDKKGVQAAADELAQMPLYGFSGAEAGFALAEPAGNAFRVFVPPKAGVEKGSANQSFSAADAEGRGAQKFVTLSNGQAARFTEGEMSLVAYVSPPAERPFVNPLKGLPWLAICLQVVFGGAALGFIVFGPQLPEQADFQNKSLPPVAVRLIAPEKKEKAKEKLAELKKKTEVKKKEVSEVKKAEKKIEDKVPQVVKAAPETKALKALAKLSSAGPMKDLLAATDKLGNGPGDKRIKNSDYKLSGLIGKAPIANAGVGLFGLGGGGKGGGATLGMEVLRGKGGGGIGALGAGGVGKGAVGGVVSRASARSISAQGSIDREAVAKTVNSHLQEVRACYERALLKEPALAGKVVLEWSISTSGLVTTAKTKSSTLRNSAVEACILQNLKTWKFPPAKGGQVIVSYPFLFNSVGY